jgi:hypothetical protein
MVKKGWFEEVFTKEMVEMKNVNGSRFSAFE